MPHAPAPPPAAVTLEPLPSLGSPHLHAPSALPAHASVTSEQLAPSLLVSWAPPTTLVQPLRAYTVAWAMELLELGGATYAAPA